MPRLVRGAVDGTVRLVGGLEVPTDVRHALGIDFETVGGAGVDHHAELVAEVADDRRALRAQHVRRRVEVLLGRPGSDARRRPGRACPTEFASTSGSTWESGPSMESELTM